MSGAPFSILGLDHVVLRCTHLEETLCFYQRVLGCSLERVVDSTGLHQLRAGGALIDLVPAESGSHGDGNMDHFCLRLAHGHWPAILEHLAAHGVEVAEPARRYGAEGYGRSVYLQDPEGNTVELKAPAS